MNKLSFSLLWRILVLHLVYISLVMLVVVPFRDNPSMAGELYMLWWGLGLLLLGFHFLTKQGLLYFLWGWRLNKSEMFWKRLNIGLVVLYVALGLSSILVASLRWSYSHPNQFGGIHSYRQNQFDDRYLSES
jgi:hypothetical protein